MKTILIVDDESLVRNPMQEFLRRSTDYTVLTASDSDQALEHFSKKQIDLMVTNINMPGMNGIELTRYVTERYDTKVIIATAMVDYQNEACDAGATEYILKPISFEIFLKLINNILLIKGNATIHKLFLSLLKKPTLNKFLKIREKVAESDQYSPYSMELNEIQRLNLEQKDHRRAISMYYSTFPNLLLNPEVHFRLSYAYTALGNESMAELEKYIGSFLINCIIRTGDGTREHPYLVLRISDEYDVLNELDKESIEQVLITDKECFLERQTCIDGTEIYFDITIPYATVNGELSFEIQKKISKDAELVDWAITSIIKEKTDRAKQILKDIVSRVPKNYKNQFMDNGEAYIKFWNMNQFMTYADWYSKSDQKAALNWELNAYPRAFYYLGYIYFENGEYEKAIEFLDKGLHLEPENFLLVSEKAQAMIRLGRHEEALTLYDEVLSLSGYCNPHHKALCLRGKGCVLIDIGKFDQAEKAYKDSLEYHPDNQTAIQELKIIYQLVKCSREAKKLDISEVEFQFWYQTLFLVGSLSLTDKDFQHMTYFVSLYREFAKEAKKSGIDEAQIEGRFRGRYYSYYMTPFLSEMEMNFNDDIDEIAREVGALSEDEIKAAKTNLHIATLNRIKLRMVMDSVDSRPSRVIKELDLSDIDAIIIENYIQDLINFINALNRMHTGDYSRTLAVVSIHDLATSGVPGDILDDLVELYESGVDENIIVIVFLNLLSQQKQFKKNMSRKLRRIVAKAYKKLPEFEDEVISKIELIIHSYSV